MALMSTTQSTTPPGASPLRRGASLALILGSLGVVFGDIGTSGLYSLQTVFAADNQAVKPTPTDVYGVISLVFWTLTIVVSIEFVTLIMRADNDGEGGIMALIALVQRASFRRAWVGPLLVTAGLFGVALFFGDGMITPAISVLSAVEGLKVAAPGLGDYVVPITLVVLTALFAAQRFGTQVIGRLFGPVMVVWFIVLTVAGAVQLVHDPAIIAALLPSHAIAFLVDHPAVSFIALGSVVLTITGTEALYADMGHFGRPAITRAWFWVVFPALIVNYLGQGSLILNSPSAIANPFFLLLPSWSQIPMVILSTIATVIASQAVISGAFSVANQAMRRGFLPRLTIRHTSNTEMGQVYAPEINWGLFIAVVALVLAFRSSTALASAYGIAVTGTLLIDTVLFLVVVRVLWHRPLWQILLAGAVFVTVNALFLAANLTKVMHGGWFPLAVAAVVFAVLSTWHRGRDRVSRIRLRNEGSLDQLLDEIHAMRPPLRSVPGTAVYLSPSGRNAPLALRAGVEHSHVMHEHVVLLSMIAESTAHIEPENRLTAEERGREGHHVTHLTAHLGFRDQLDAPATLTLAREQDLVPGLDVDGAVYFVSATAIIVGDAPGMMRWRKRLFVFLTHNAANPLDYFHLPSDRTVLIGTRVSV